MRLPTDMKRFRAEDYAPTPLPVRVMDALAFLLVLLILIAFLWL